MDMWCFDLHGSVDVRERLLPCLLACGLNLGTACGRGHRLEDVAHQPSSAHTSLVIPIC